MILTFKNNKRYKYDYFDIKDIYDFIKNGTYKCNFYNTNNSKDNLKKRVDFVYNLPLKKVVTNIRGLKKNTWNHWDLFFNTNWKVLQGKDVLKKGLNDSYVNKIKTKNPLIFASDLKNSLPACLFSIKDFHDIPHPSMKNKPNSLNNNIKSLNKYISIDIDHLPENVIDDIKSKLFERYDYIKMIFRSPSGDGIKIIIEFKDNTEILDDINDINYDIISKIWTNINDMIVFDLNENNNAIEIVRDEAADDINRLCYLSYDSKCLYRENCNPFVISEYEIEGEVIKDKMDFNKIKIKKEKELEEKRKRLSNITTDVEVEVNKIRNFINMIDLFNVEPFGAHNYKDYNVVGFGICDLFNRESLYYELAYDLFYQITIRDSHYGNYQGKGEEEIRRQFDIKWNIPKNDGITYGSFIYWMNHIKDTKMVL